MLVFGLPELPMHTLHWIGPSPEIRWIQNLKHHLVNGGLVLVKTDTGLIARVAGDVNVAQPRTTELGAVLTVCPAPLPGVGAPLFTGERN